MLSKLIKVSFALLLHFLFGTSAFSQDGTDPIELDNSDIIIYKAPATSFEDIHIQSHKGLPRFGEN